jgi:tRNA pseudouridine38-40 synthase
MRRVALCVCYDGSRYHGWQHQEEVATVQQTVEHAVSRVADQPITLVCAGRTDAGVHATAQVAHFDTEADRTERSWMFGANSNLPADISECGQQ